MANILELLKNEKVEWKKLKDILVSINTGLNPRKNFILNDINGELTSWYITTKDYSLTEKIEFIEGKTARITEEARKIINKRSNLEKGDLLFSAVGTVGKVALVEIEPKNFDVNESTFILKPNKNIIIDKYLLHYLRGSIFQSKLSSKLRGSTLTGIRKGDLENFEIPIPSLETQEKIVEILDKFTNYVTELQSELQSRTKQYTYYRDMLLSEEYLNKITKEMEEDRRLSKVKLEEVVTIKNGKDWKKLEKGDIPVYGSGGEMGVYVDKYSYDKPTVLIPRKGSIENVFYLDKPFWNVDTIFHTEIDESKLMPKYFYYFIEQYDLSKLSDNPTRPSLTQSTLNKLIMDLPPLSLQNKIVKVLDKFQLLLEDTNGLLPEEIEQRQKQYEYYRKKLLTFDIDSDSTHARTHARTIISNLYYDTLHNAAKLVGVETKDKVEWHKLGQIFYTKNGYTPSKNVEEFWNNGNIPWFRMEDIRAKGNILYDSFLHVTENAVKKGGVFKKNSIILATSATIGEHALVKVSFLSNQRFTCFTRKDEFEQELNIEFAYYYFYKIDEWCKNNISLGSFPSIDVTKLLVKKMPIPPLHVQQHVVNVLDKFDTLVNDIKEGLPKEIEQRQKQYEYWREQLLSFNL